MHMKTIDLWKKNVKIGETLVSDEDFDRLNQIKWYLNSCGYAIKTTQISMHRLILNLSVGDGIIVDHINGNPLDNRRENLRIVTRQGNMQNRKMHKNNTSGFIGVYWDKTNQVWLCRVKVNNKHIHVGRYRNPEEANLAAIAKRKELGFLDSNPS